MCLVEGRSEECRVREAAVVASGQLGVGGKKLETRAVRVGADCSGDNGFAKVKPWACVRHATLCTLELDKQ